MNFKVLLLFYFILISFTIYGKKSEKIVKSDVIFEKGVSVPGWEATFLDHIELPEEKIDKELPDSDHVEKKEEEAAVRDRDVYRAKKRVSIKKKIVKKDPEPDLKDEFNYEHYFSLDAESDEISDSDNESDPENETADLHEEALPTIDESNMKDTLSDADMDTPAPRFNEIDPLREEKQLKRLKTIKEKRKRRRGRDRKNAF